MAVPYNELAKKARDQVLDLDEPYKSIAYETILQDLIRESRRGEVTESKRSSTPKPTEGVEDPVGLFMTNIVDAGQYTKLLATKGKIVEKSLVVLKLARDQLGIDGLTSPQITEVLTKKFRVPKVHRQNVSNGLAAATEYVHRLVVNDEHKYLLMAPGEQHLQEVISQSG